ncbi:MAG: hypothetical protein MK132_10815 [Lentisphaerales bacterium]|nr:hypothetical protein [Lentisphaerales bacterium]
MMVKLFSIFILAGVFLLTGCKEAKEGADAVSGKVTGQQDMEIMKKTEKNLQMLQDKTNKQQQDALKQLEK